MFSEKLSFVVFDNSRQMVALYFYMYVLSNCNILFLGLFYFVFAI